MSRVIHAIHLSDSHVGPARDVEVRGANPLDRLERVVAAIRSLDFVPDFVIHTGDLVNEPDPASYRLAAEALSPLPSPLYCVTGNHDDDAMMAGIIPMGPRTPLAEGPDRLAYRFSLPGLEAFVLDAKVPEEEGPHGELPVDQLEALEAALSASECPFAVFMHFPPFAIGSAWIDAHLPLRNGEALHDILKRQDARRARGAFFGHLHRGVHLARDGVFYSGVASPASEFSSGVHDDRVEWTGDCPLAFHHLTFSDAGVAVKCLFAR